MASAIPMALSLLQAVAPSNSAPQKSATNGGPLNPSAATQSSSHTTKQSSSAPVNIPGSQSNTTSNHKANSAMAAGSPPPKSNSNLCDYCHLRPKYADGSKIHLYCGRTCATKAKSSGGSTSSNSTTSSSSNSSNCDFCHTRPKYHDGVQTHPYCSKACANSARYKKSGSKGGTCQAPGCTKPVHASSSKGSIGEYCSLAHKTLGENICLMCRQAPKMANSHFCSQTCTDDAENNAPSILEVPQGHSTFKSVADQFKSSWRHGSTCPPVKHVYKIMGSQTSLTAYNTYRNAVEVRGQFVATGRSAGNENRRWHGTTRECTLGDKGQTQFCSSPTCSLCCIVKSSFDLSLFGKKTGWGRFGKGIYTSSTSSKSNDYSRNASSCNSQLKAILLNKVVVGKGCKMLHDSTSMTAPPSGYDSVLAEKGGSLNYDELVVYTNDAIRPSFLVMYEP
ncbi:hypothetical protein F5887DRAFT_1075647 [Amanita rubescens]|nr:hypothetical protein F5887DRAFT_1075647 [Amanita rubescens]